MDLKSDSRRADQNGSATRAPRAAGSDIAACGEVRLSPGGIVDLINLSETGALVETPSRFAVGAAVALCLGGARPQRLPGRVVRCQVCGIHRDNTMSYQIGIAFEDSARAEVPDQSADAAPAAVPDAPPSETEPARAMEVEELANEW